MKKVLVTILVIILVIAVASGVVFYVLYQKATDLSEADKLVTTESKTIYEPLLKSVLLKEPQEITDDDINGLLVSIMNKHKENQKTKSDFSIDGIAVYMQNDNQVKIYANIYYKETRFIFSALADVRLDTAKEKVYFDITQTKVGTLEISKETVIKYLTEYIDNQKNLFLSTEDNSITIPSKYDITVPITKQEVSIFVESLNISQGKADIQTNSLMNIVSNFLSDYLLSLIQ